jgi:protein TonB
MTSAALSRWLGISVAAHVALFGGLWFWSNVMWASTPPARTASLIVTLINPLESPIPAAQPTAPSPVRPHTIQTPDRAAPLIEIVPESIPHSPVPDGTAMQPFEVPPEPLSAPTQSRPEASEAVAADAFGDTDDGRSSVPNNSASVYAEQDGANEHYRALILGILERAKRYPLAAQRRGFEGTVEIAFLINADGRISDARIIVPSPYRVLDEATLAMVHRVKVLPAPPGLVPQRFPVRIEYTLDSIASPISTEGVRP